MQISLVVPVPDALKDDPVGALRWFEALTSGLRSAGFTLAGVPRVDLQRGVMWFRVELVPVDFASDKTLTDEEAERLKQRFRDARAEQLKQRLRQAQR